jgi:hypothetical protein
MIGLGKRVAFDFDWKAQRWNLIDGFRCDDGRFCSGSVYGDPSNVAINPKLLLSWHNWDDTPNGKLMPDLPLDLIFSVLKRYFDLVSRGFNRF